MKKAILLLMLVATINITKSQCTADYTYSVDPVNSLKLTFTSTSTFPAGSFNFSQKWYVFSNMVDSLNTTTVITFTAGGTYKIKLFVKACIGGGTFTSDDTTRFITVTDLSTGINENQKENLFSIFPNPVSDGVITLKRAKGDLNNNYSISNISGQVVKTGTLNEYTEAIDINGLDSGMYFVSNGTRTVKILKN